MISFSLGVAGTSSLEENDNHMTINLNSFLVWIELDDKYHTDINVAMKEFIDDIMSNR